MPTASQTYVMLLAQILLWATINTDLVQGQKADVKRKLQKMGNIIYSNGAERYGVTSKIPTQI